MLDFQLAAAFMLFQESAYTEPKSNSSFWLFIFLAFLIGLIVGIIITETFNIVRKSISKSDVQQTHSTITNKTAKQEAPQTKPYISLCPACHTSYTDPNLRYCLSDGTQLFMRPKNKNYDPDATIMSPEI